MSSTSMLPRSWRETVFYPVAVAGMVAATLTPLSQIIHDVSDRPEGRIIVLGVIAALMGYYMTFRSILPRYLRRNGITLFFTEAVTFYVLVKAAESVQALLIGQGLSFNLFEVQFQTLAALVLMFICWEFARSIAFQFTRIHRLPLENDETETISPEYVPPYRRIRQAVFGGGFLTLLLAGIARVGVDSAFDFDRAFIRGTVTPVLVYFLLSLVLLSQARYDALRRRWTIDGVQVDPSMGIQWLMMSLVSMGLATGIAFFLPVRQWGVLLTAIRRLIAVGFAYFNYVMMWLLNFFTSFLNGTETTPDSSALEPVAPPNFGDFFQSTNAATPTETAEPFMTVLNLGWLQTIVSWVLVVVVIGYATRAILRENPMLAASLRRGRLMRMLQTIWDEIAGFWGSSITALRDLMPAEVAEESTAAGEQRPRRRRNRNLKNLDPPERVRAAYLDTLDQLAEDGSPRHPHQTPREYQERIYPLYPDSREDFAQLTDAFIKARYSQASVDDPDGDQALTLWERIRRRLARG